jgi:hypothetical protein
VEEALFSFFFKSLSSIWWSVISEVFDSLSIEWFCVTGGEPL